MFPLVSLQLPVLLHHMPNIEIPSGAWSLTQSNGVHCTVQAKAYGTVQCAQNHPVKCRSFLLTYYIVAEAILPFALKACTSSLPLNTEMVLWQTPASSLRVVAEDRTNAHRLQQSCGEKGTVWYPLKKRVLWLPLSRGECPDPCLDRLLLFLSHLIIYYIECCLHFRYNQGNKNNKCRRETWWADYALSLGKSIQALDITLKIGNKHLLFQTRAREF